MEAILVDDIETPSIPAETLQSIEVQLQELSKRQPTRRQRRYSQLDLVRAKYDEIEALVDRGFSIDEIAKCFVAANEPLEASTLRSYLSRIRTADKTGARRKRKAKQKRTLATTSGAKPPAQIEKENTRVAVAQTTRNGSTMAKQVEEHMKHSGEQSFAPGSVLEKAKEKLQAIEAEQEARPLRGSFVVIEDRPDL